MIAAKVRHNAVLFIGLFVWYVRGGYFGPF